MQLFDRQGKRLYLSAEERAAFLEAAWRPCSLAIEALLEGEAEGLTRKAVEMALGGDTTAL